MVLNVQRDRVTSKPMEVQKEVDQICMDVINDVAKETTIIPIENVEDINKSIEQIESELVTLYDYSYYPSVMYRI